MNMMSDATISGGLGSDPPLFNELPQALQIEVLRRTVSSLHEAVSNLKLQLHHAQNASDNHQHGLDGRVLVPPEFPRQTTFPGSVHPPRALQVADEKR